MRSNAFWRSLLDAINDDIYSNDVAPESIEALKGLEFIYEREEIDVSGETSDPILFRAKVLARGNHVGWLVMVGDRDEGTLMAYDSSKNYINNVLSCSPFALYEEVRASRFAKHKPTIADVRRAVEGNDPTIDLSMLAAQWNETRLAHALWSILDELPRWQQLGLTERLAHSVPSTEQAFSQFCRLGAKGEWGRSYCLKTGAQRCWTKDCEALFCETPDQRELVELIVVASELAPTFKQDIQFVGARHGVEPKNLDLGRYVELHLSRPSRGWAFSQAERIPGWAEQCAAARSPSDTISALRLLGKLHESERSSTLEQVVSATDLTAALTRYVEELVATIHKKNIPRDYWLALEPEEYAALEALPADAMEGLRDHPDLEECVRGLIARGKECSAKLLELIPPERRDDLILECIEIILDDLVAWAVGKFVTFDDSNREKEFDALAQLIERGHPLEDLRSAGHLAFVYGKELGPVRQKAVRAEIASLTPGRWRAVRFVPLSRSKRRPALRVVKPAEQDRFSKFAARGRSLVVAGNDESTASHDAIAATIHSQRTGKSLPPRTMKQRSQQLGALWAEVLVAELGWTLLCGKPSTSVGGSYEQTLVAPHHAAVLFPVALIHELLAPSSRSSLPSADDIREQAANAQAFEYRTIAGEKARKDVIDIRKLKQSSKPV